MKAPDSRQLKLDDMLGRQVTDARRQLAQLFAQPIPSLTSPGHVIAIAMVQVAHADALCTLQRQMDYIHATSVPHWHKRIASSGKRLIAQTRGGEDALDIAQDICGRNQAADLSLGDIVAMFKLMYGEAVRIGDPRLTVITSWLDNLSETLAATGSAFRDLVTNSHLVSSRQRDWLSDDQLPAGGETEIESQNTSKENKQVKRRASRPPKQVLKHKRQAAGDSSGQTSDSGDMPS